mmetsp:Transcript_20846/g.67027  ORF Transcript_20846/g.67027 Transcript_20846/m.67027 type:complete len:357 (-) Transcript_20846:637-1707(-)
MGQHICDLTVARVESVGQGRVAPAVTRVGVGAVGEQEANGFHAALAGSQVQCRAQVPVGEVDGDALGKHVLHGGQVTLCRSVDEDQLGDRPLVAPTGPAALRLLLGCAAGQSRALGVPLHSPQVAQPVEGVQLRELLQELDRAHAVAELVQPWREDGDAHQVWHNRVDAAAHARLGGQEVGLEAPLARVVVQPRRRHLAEHALHRERVEHAVRSEHVEPSVGQRGGHDGHLPGASLQAARLDVQLQRVRQRPPARQHVVLGQVVGQREVAVGGGAFGEEDGGVDGDVGGGEAAPGAHDGVDALAEVQVGANEAGAGDGTRVDTHVMRAVGHRSRHLALAATIVPLLGLRLRAPRAA